MDHPAVLNAVNLRMHEQLAEIWDDFEQDEDIGVGVLTGSGDPSFSVGQDLRKPAERNRTEIRQGRPGRLLTGREFSARRGDEPGHAGGKAATSACVNVQP